VGLFLVVGGAQLIVDWITFVLLTKIGIDSIASNLAGRLAGACLGFLLNGKFTFLHKRKARSITSRSALRFAAFWIAASLVSTAAVSTINSYAGLKAAWLGKPVIEAILAIISFLCSKFWIYRH
jgi:putative flippase GtrA